MKAVTAKKPAATTKGQNAVKKNAIATAKKPAAKNAANAFAGAGNALGAGIDALFAQDDLPEFPVNLDDVEIVEQVREEFESDDQSLDELGDSLAKFQIQAILLRVMPAGHPKPYRLVAGERRMRAARMKGLLTLRAKAKEMTDEEAEDLQFAENIHRLNLSQIEGARKVQRDLDALGSVEAVLEKHNKSRAWLSKVLSLLHLPEQAKRLVTENISADTEVISTVRQVEKVSPAKAKELVDDLKQSRGKQDARVKAQAVRDEVKPKKDGKDKKGADKGTTVAQPKDTRTIDILAEHGTAVDVSGLLVDIYQRLTRDDQRPEQVLAELKPEEISACLTVLKPAFDTARKAESSGKHVFAGLRAGRYSTEGAGALLLAACMCGFDATGGELRLDEIFAVVRA
ncbi:ParB/RepB/Spo0J family partition protein (plasmid) [Acidovorax sp. 210-6]|uniref:ParB/RepB/Spo0J family partition protein n=1 Tax=Acidovorax sp. 210-6 TaxID=2699468 RepID=UPI00138A6653|nr:ParB/RepB/Spo0J family partition protein [Acidovorax sp. 210-6]NCU67962.1 ParB/RepB/Spo0J family partition protein [Acidovorax sp. 210-6]